MVTNVLHHETMQQSKRPRRIYKLKKQTRFLDNSICPFIAHMDLGLLWCPSQPWASCRPSPSALASARSGCDAWQEAGTTSRPRLAMGGRATGDLQLAVRADFDGSTARSREGTTVVHGVVGEQINLQRERPLIFAATRGLTSTSYTTFLHITRINGPMPSSSRIFYEICLGMAQACIRLTLSKIRCLLCITTVSD